MGAQTPIFFEWYWERLGNFKYAFVVPVVANATHGFLYPAGAAQDVQDNWCFHLLLLGALRYICQQLWTSYSRLHCLVKKHQINACGIEFEQVDREFHSDNHMLLQLLFLLAAHSWLPGFSNLPMWNMRGLIILLLLHAGPVEFLYYWIHRAFHSQPLLFQSYHSFHHLSVVTEPPTGSVTTMLEQVLQTGLIGVAMVGTVMLGGGSISMIYIYLLAFDSLKCMGHCNCEFIPATLFQLFPIAKYLLYTPSYHSLHHTELHYNFCLFMPLYDYLGGTVHPNTLPFFASLRKGKAEEELVPDFIFLAHCIDVLTSLHVSFCIRTLAAYPFTPHWFLWLLWLPTLICLFPFWMWAQTFVAYQYILDNLNCVTCVIPRHGFQYFLPFYKDNINKHIEKAILNADAKGVKVVSLAALNKNEELNGGGALFVEKHKDLRVRVVHGNTLTAAVIIKQLPVDVKEVFMTGATSKLGRAIALYLCQRGVRVLMFTKSKERFDKIAKEAPQDMRHNLIQVTKFQAGQNCKTWLFGKWTFNADQRWAPPGTNFHQFVVPAVNAIRKDCTYAPVAGMMLPKQVIGVHTCEVIMPRKAVHACHAGGLVHALEGWKHHEVGAVDVDRIDVVWEAAMKHGFSSVT
ncbi:hypothetical protein BDL97_07G103400 [Sphagnum fallax]|nr:hypothetical protein BDL97_07G103400 [Sphagnum fallax]KAH8957647.1 hypothetical protein BDL97_07G103400 [Sphagnum fallax]KAH8957648.1 hypothetical protein BDL97_07G103400 [Sphagnum fallax]KAH8957649.1 hypothetical protein BDL97_07G103400 [Sphagnum fallax]